MTEIQLRSPELVRTLLRLPALVVDLETTGLADPAIVQVGIAVLRQNLVVEPVFESLVWTPKAAEDSAPHTLRPTTDAPDWPHAEILATTAILRRAWDIRCAQSAWAWSSFDGLVIELENARHALCVAPHRWHRPSDAACLVDLAFVQDLDEEGKRRRWSIDRIAERLGIPLPPDRHTALADAVLTAQILAEVYRAAHR